MNSPDDKQGDHDLKAYLDGRDGVSAAYRQTAHEEPPAALDRLILAAARGDAKPAPHSVFTPRKSYALAASVMLALVALSLYFGELDEVVLQSEPASPQAGARTIRIERGVADQATAEPAADAAVADVTAAGAADGADDEAFKARELTPAVPTIGAGAVAPAPGPAREDADEAFARTTEAPALVIDGPLLQRIEAEADAAQAQGAAAQLEEITVTGSRIVRRGDTSYRASREDWLVVLRGKKLELERSARLTAAQRRTAELENELEQEIELFLAQYPDTDLDAELWFAE